MTCKKLISATDDVLKSLSKDFTFSLDNSQRKIEELVVGIAGQLSNSTKNDVPSFTQVKLFFQLKVMIHNQPIVNHR